VVWGSRLVLKLIERYPSVIYIGGAVLAFTAAKMVLNEPVLKTWTSVLPEWVYWLIVVASVAAVLAVGMRMKRAKEVSGGSDAANPAG
jgi:predicted tellurium resistance membrane protein TerC